MFCSKCGTEVSVDAAFCMKCGNRLEEDRFETENGDTRPVDAPRESIVCVLKQTKVHLKGPLKGAIERRFDQLVGAAKHEQLETSDVVFTSKRILLFPSPRGPKGLGTALGVAGIFTGGMLGGALVGLGDAVPDALGSRRERLIDDPAAIEKVAVPTWLIDSANLVVEESRPSLLSTSRVLLFRISGPCSLGDVRDQMELLFAIGGRVTNTPPASRPESYEAIAALFRFDASQVIAK